MLAIDWSHAKDLVSQPGAEGESIAILKSKRRFNPSASIVIFARLHILGETK